MKKTNISISSISIISLLLLTFLASFLFGFIYYNHQKKQELSELQRHLTTSLHQLTKGLSIAVWNFDENQIKGIIESGLQDENITQLTIEYYDKNHTIYTIKRDGVKGSATFTGMRKPVKGELILENDIFYSNERIGKLIVFASTENLLHELKQELGLIVLFIILLILFLVGGVYCVLYFIIIKPLKLLEQFSLSINFENHNPPLSIDKKFFKEIEHLSFSLQKMVTSMNSSYNKIEHSERKFKDMANLLPQSVFETDMQGNLTFINEMGLKLFGMTRSDFEAGLNVTQLIAPENREVLHANVAARYNGNTFPDGNEYKGIKKDGTIFPFISFSTVVWEAGKQIGIRGVSVDLTDQRKNEAALNELIRLNFEKEKESEKLRTLSLIEGQEKERLRISKDIHDGIGQMMTAIKLSSESINPDSISSQTDLEKLEYTKSLIYDVMSELRQVSNDLSPTFLYDYGLFAAIKHLATNISKISPISIHLNSNVQQLRFLSLVEITLYRIIQEALNNALKYSQAKNIRIHLIEDAEFLELSIEDDGVGYDLSLKRLSNSTSGNGLKNISSRANLIGGHLSIVTEEGQGFQINIQIPLKNTVG